MLTAATSLAILTTFLYRDTILASSTPAPSPHGSSIVDTGYAKYEGNRTFPNAVAYLGVPYAEPPLGRLRFRAPVPLKTSRVGLESGGKIVNAKEYPDFCIQGTTGSGDAGGAGSEDCLKVNVYAPAGATKNSKFPVLVYIHGGGYIYGNPRNWPFDHWVAQSPNTVIVSVYYRLSSFGFLAHPELRDDPTLGTLNAGFLDQIQALRWVKDHIASFGGDPGRVTINGESAGGSSVALHLVASNEGEQLFNRAIAQSVYRTPVPMPEQQPLFQYYADQAGCGKGAVAEQVECLRKAPVSALARAQDSARPPAFTASGYNTFHPVVDGKVLTDYPTKLISQGKFARVPLIVGATTNETLSGGVDIASALVKFFPSITDTDIEELGQAYPIQAFDSENLRFQVLTGESELKCANSILGTAYSNAGLKTWVYRYNQRNPTNPNPAVTHAAENWMMFLGSNTGTNGSATFSPQTSAERAFVSELIAYWLSFVRTGDPNTHKLPKSPTWSGYTAGTRNKIVLQQEDTKDEKKSATRKSGSFLEKETKEETERCVVVAGLVETQQN